jgi:hypothetical protein
VINIEILSAGSSLYAMADGAQAVLLLKHPIEVGDGDAVLPAEEAVARVSVSGLRLSLLAPAFGTLGRVPVRTAPVLDEQDKVPRLTTATALLVGTDGLPRARSERLPVRGPTGQAARHPTPAVPRRLLELLDALDHSAGIAAPLRLHYVIVPYRGVPY